LAGEEVVFERLESKKDCKRDWVVNRRKKFGGVSQENFPAKWKERGLMRKRKRGKK